MKMKCQNAQPMISDYIDNALSARETLDLDKHLASCHECTRTLNEMRRTVVAMASTPQLQVSEDFMAKLQSRLADVERAPRRKAWFAGFADMFRPRLLPVWGTAGACCALFAFMLISSKPVNRTIAPPDNPRVAIQDAKTQNVVLAASNPLEDLSAANLAAHPASDMTSENETIE